MIPNLLTETCVGTTMWQTVVTSGVCIFFQKLQLNFADFEQFVFAIPSNVWLCVPYSRVFSEGPKFHEFLSFYTSLENK